MRFNDQIYLTTEENEINYENALKLSEEAIKKIEDTVGHELTQKLKDLCHLNILITGKSGVGKSTLINNIFMEELAKEDVGEPVTKEISALTKESIPLTIYDTPGIELDPAQQKKLIHDIFDLISELRKTNDVNKCIHCIWYCIHCGSSRLEESEIQFINNFTNDSQLGKTPVIVVMTQCYADDNRDQLKRVIASKVNNIVGIVPVVAKDKSFGKFIVPSYGLDKLVDVTYKNLDEILQQTLINVQIVSIKYKRISAAALVSASVVACSAIGASPIPFADAVILAPIEFGMLSCIAGIYKLNVPLTFIYFYCFWLCWRKKLIYQKSYYFINCILFSLYFFIFYLIIHHMKLFVVSKISKFQLKINF